MALRAVATGAIITALLMAILSGIALAAEAFLESHEDPSQAPLVFEGAPLLQSYSRALDQALKKDADGVKAVETYVLHANTPPELAQSIGEFMSSGLAIAEAITAVEKNLEAGKKLISQYLPDEAEKNLEAVEERLSQAYEALYAMEMSTYYTGERFEVSKAAAGSELDVAYKGTWERLRSLRSLLDLFKSVLQGQAGQVDILQQGSTEQPRFLVTQLSLSISPTSVFVGESIEFWGSLKAEGRPLAARKVSLLLEGVPVDDVETDSAGSFGGALQIPYSYVPEMSLQALYYPEGDDIGLYLGSSSATVTIQTLFYETRLSLEVSGPAYPGREISVKGGFDYGDDPIPESRAVLIYWNGQQVAEERVTESFVIDIPVDARTHLGRYEIAAYAAAQERYSPAWAKGEVEVVRAVPIIDIAAPNMVLLPFGLSVAGRAYSELGPLQDAPLKIKFGGSEMAATTGQDGTFSARINTGMSLTLVGSQELTVQITPQEPWISEGYSSRGLTVISPINMGGILFVLAGVSIPLARRLRQVRWRFARTPSPQPPRPAPIMVTAEEDGRRDGISGLAQRGSPGYALLRLYRNILRLIQGMTSALLKPSQTLREFAAQCAPLLGPLAGHFQEFTGLVERLLYSRHGLGEAEAARGKELGQNLEEGLRREST